MKMKLVETLCFQVTNARMLALLFLLLMVMMFEFEEYVCCFSFFSGLGSIVLTVVVCVSICGHFRNLC